MLSMDQQDTDDIRLSSLDQIIDDNEFQDEQLDELIINCVKTGNARLLDLLLYEPGSNINIVHYGENLLMLAIRMGHEEVAKFLLENGADINFEKKVFYKTKSKGEHFLNYFTIDCRQMAYRKEMYDLVKSMDFLNNNYNRFRATPSLNLRDRSEKPGMFFDVISLHEEFFNPTTSVAKCQGLSADSIATLSTTRSESVPRTKSDLNNKCIFNPRETKSSFLRKRTSSAVNRSSKDHLSESLGVSQEYPRIKSAICYK